MTCPICGRAAEAKYRPFCSRRCADVDLGNWLKGNYRIAAAEDEEAAPQEPGGRDPGASRH
ncbi:DNA gyrase inhibitor YacG [Cereibacter azotoformans]|uniref:DNA gyrase inhibitor YacG n=1 Tax=Cereibacter azotoformans TaxID=43057 RepID=UPI001EE9D13D|nr:DNA gyrase inhibitor YacG [Cereibacter azotoformans]ULB08909.1 DNA gyrase inhibitor YacG [Cereibacter azotoformans]